MDNADQEAMREHISRLVRGIKARQTELQPVIRYLEKTKNRLDGLIPAGLQGISRQEGYEHISRVEQLEEQPHLWTWVDTMFWEPSTATLKASWVVRTLQSVLNATVEASDLVAKALTVLKRCSRKEIVAYDAETVFAELRAITNIDEEFRKDIKDALNGHLRAAKATINTFLQGYDEQKALIDGGACKRFKKLNDAERREMLISRWNAAFESTSENRERSVFRSKILVFLILAQVPQVTDLKKAVKPLDRAIGHMEDMFGAKKR